MGTSEVTTEVPGAEDGRADDRLAPLSAAATARVAAGAKNAAPPPASVTGRDKPPAAKRPASRTKSANGNRAAAAKRAANGARRPAGNGTTAAKRAANGATPANGNGAKPSNGNAKAAAKPSNANGKAAPKSSNGNAKAAAKPSNANAKAAAKPSNANAKAAPKRVASGSKPARDAAAATRRPALEPDELLALVESVQRTVQRPAAAVAEAAVAAPEPRERDDLPIEPLAPVRRTRARAVPGAAVRSRPLPADRRAKLLATIARNAEEQALAEGRDAGPTAARKRGHSKRARRLLALCALLAPPVAAAVLLATHASGTTLSRVDATFISEQLVVADQRLRAQLQRVPLRGTARAIERARAATLTTRSLTLEVRGSGGDEAARLTRALRLEGDWLDAVGSTLRNPRSPLHGELIARDAEARAALAALPGTQGHRQDGTQALVGYARSRVLAATAGMP